MASCDGDGCGWSTTQETEAAALLIGEHHERGGWCTAATRAAVAKAAKAFEPPADIHVHSYRCTDASCPGNGFPTREAVIGR